MMAQYFIDFSNDEVGLIPQGFTSRWNSTTWEIVEDANSIGGKILKNTGGTKTPKHLGYSDLGNIQDVEVVAKVKNTTNTASQNRLHLRASTTNVSCYSVGLWANQIQIIKYVNGTYGGIGSYNFPMQINTWYMLRFRVNGNNLYARIWEHGSEEPTVWQITGIDNSLINGEVGFGVWDVNGARYFDIIGIGTDGDAAPVGVVNYNPVGNYTTMSIQVNGEYRIKWLESKPQNTNIIIEYTTGETRGEWQAVSNGEVVNANTNLWIKTTLSTEDKKVTPTLQDLWIEPSEVPADTIRLIMNDYFRFNNVAGDLTVFYDGAGSLAGFDGPVEEFTESFTPIGLVAKPHQDDQEHIEVLGITSATGKLTRIYFSDIDQAEDQGHIELLGITSATGVLTHIDNI